MLVMRKADCLVVVLVALKVEEKEGWKVEMWAEKKAGERVVGMVLW